MRVCVCVFCLFSTLLADGTRNIVFIRNYFPFFFCMHFKTFRAMNVRTSFQNTVEIIMDEKVRENMFVRVAITIA